MAKKPNKQTNKKKTHTEKKKREDKSCTHSNKNERENCF